MGSEMCIRDWKCAEIDLKALPGSAHFNGLAPAEERAELMLRGGDDYELCVCLSPEVVEEAQQRLDVPLTEIGRITAEPGLRSIDASGTQPQDASGYRHF